MNRAKEDFDYNKSSSAKKAIRQPLQERSRKKMDDIMNALESLLAEKPFDRITMAELAQKSGAGTSSIYARFSDKNSLILGVHLRLRETALACLEKLTDPARWDGVPTEDMVRQVISTIFRWYKKHQFLIRAALYVDDAVVRERQALTLRLAAEKFGALLGEENAKTAKKVGLAVDASVRIVTSVMYSVLMFGSVELVRSSVSDRELCRQLSCAVIALINDAGISKSVIKATS